MLDYELPPLERLELNVSKILLLSFAIAFLPVPALPDTTVRDSKPIGDDTLEPPRNLGSENANPGFASKEYREALERYRKAAELGDIGSYGRKLSSVANRAVANASCGRNTATGRRRDSCGRSRRRGATPCSSSTTCRTLPLSATFATGRWGNAAQGGVRPRGDPGGSRRPRQKTRSFYIHALLPWAIGNRIATDPTLWYVAARSQTGGDLGRPGSVRGRTDADWSNYVSRKATCRAA